MKRTFDKDIFLLKLASLFLKYNFFSEEKEFGLANDILTDVYSCLTVQGKDTLFERYTRLENKK